MKTIVTGSKQWSDVDLEALELLLNLPVTVDAANPYRIIISGSAEKEIPTLGIEEKITIQVIQ